MNCATLLELGDSYVFERKFQIASKSFPKGNKPSVCLFDFRYILPKGQRYKLRPPRRKICVDYPSEMLAIAHGNLPAVLPLLLVRRAVLPCPADALALRLSQDGLFILIQFDDIAADDELFVIELPHGSPFPSILRGHKNTFNRVKSSGRLCRPRSPLGGHGGLHSHTPYAPTLPQGDLTA